MSGLWTPPGTQAPRARLPQGDVRADGIGVLRRTSHPMGWPCWRGPRGLAVLASMDDTPHGDLLHVSLSYADHDPPWSVIRAVRDAFFPADVDAMMVLPRAEDYVSGAFPGDDSHVFHLWQTPTVWGLQ